MDFAAIIAFLMSVPVVGPWVAIALKVLLPLSVIATAVVALAHATIAVMKAMALIPGLAGLSALSDKLKVKADAAEGFFNTKVKPILDRLSLIPLPKQAALK